MQGLFFLAAVGVVLLVGVVVAMIAPLWNAWIDENPWRAVHLAKRGWLGFIGDQVGGYVNDTQMSQWISPNMCSFVTGTWTDAAGAVTGTVVKACAAADQTSVIYIPVSAAVPSNAAAQKGSYFKSIDIYFAVTTAALDAAGATALIDRFVLPANNAAFPTLVAHAFTYDAGNDTAAESDDLDEHTMTLTVTTPFWLDNDDLVQVRLTLDAATTSVIRFHGARVNTTLRI